jgi:hypothetical protein
MSMYTQVQFVSWEIYTGKDFANARYPGTGSKLEPFFDLRTQLTWQCQDIDARVAFTKDAIEKALEKADRSAKVLKIFMAPEFLYRGAAGAYLHDLLEGWEGDAPFGPEKEIDLASQYRGPWKGLFGQLRDLVQGREYEDWIFVFGSAASATFPTKKVLKNEIVMNPDETVERHSVVLEALDLDRSAEVNNISLIQRGGNHRSDGHVCGKKWKSQADYIRSNRSAGRLHVDDRVRAMDGLKSEDVLERAGDPYAGGAYFKFQSVRDSKADPIQFGIEICVDHARGRLLAAGDLVRIQLVPSCGLSDLERETTLLDQSRPSYIFNCDGSAGGNEEFGSTTRIGDDDWVTGRKRLLLDTFFRDGDELMTFEYCAVEESLQRHSRELFASDLWNSGSDGDDSNGSGMVCIAQPLPL